MSTIHEDKTEWDGFNPTKNHRGWPVCGAEFMAGTLCSLERNHERGHGTICQCCDRDWYSDGHCFCVHLEDGDWNCPDDQPS